jgi:hypothetical protein
VSSAQLVKRKATMRIPQINWSKVVESIASLDPYGPVFMADGSIYSTDGQMLVAPRDTAEIVDRPARADAHRRVHAQPVLGRSPERRDRVPALAA